MGRCAVSCQHRDLKSEPFWFRLELRRKDGELRVWMTGQTVMTTKVGVAPSHS
jgi:hypothetical protein